MKKNMHGKNHVDLHVVLESRLKVDCILYTLSFLMQSRVFQPNLESAHPGIGQPNSDKSEGVVSDSKICPNGKTNHSKWQGGFCLHLKDLRAAQVGCKATEHSIDHL